MLGGHTASEVIYKIRTSFQAGRTRWNKKCYHMLLGYRWITQIGAGISASHRLVAAVLPGSCFECAIVKASVKTGHQNNDVFCANQTLTVGHRFEMLQIVH
ncbi:hypothetical protein GOODEAATRI_021083 [Goodea atripinnis]|uniref:Uncharacterized protein n=1 Tax=Goodea atripinnis TaxID=208336 RepID=A0ABV0N366_9TELE